LTATACGSIFLPTIKEAKMLNDKDRENVVKSSQAANLLVSDLRAVASADEPLLADVALDLLQQVVQIEDRLKRIEATTRKEKPA
jgi:hypothetical protein